MAISQSEFAKRMSLMAKPAEDFRPFAYYDPDGDCIEFLIKPDPFYAERVDDLVTVYYSQDTDEVVGSLLKGVSKFCQDAVAKMPGFKVEIRDGKIKLEHVFRLRMWTSTMKPRDLPTLTYQKLIDVAEKADLETENFECLTV